MTAGDENPEQCFNRIEIKGPRILLLPYDEDRDFDRIAEMLSDPHVTGPMGIPQPSPFVDELRKAKQYRNSRPQSGDWTIFLVDNVDNLDNDKLIFTGEVGIADWDPEFLIVEIFASIVPGCAGRGLGREAVSLLAEHIFTRSPIACVRIQALETNTASLKLALSLGFRETGRRWVDADPGRGFVGGMAVIMDLRIHEFRPFELKED